MKKILSLIIACTLILTIIPQESLAAENQPLMGDHIYYGSYNGEAISWEILELNGDKALIWSDYIISFKGFDGAESGIHMATGNNCYTALAFADRYGDSRWHLSTIRDWLNSDESHVEYTGMPPYDAAFYRGTNGYDDEVGFLYHFSTNEKDAILTTSLTTYDEIEDKDITTKDQVFLLTSEEAAKYSGNSDLIKLATYAAFEADEDIWRESPDLPYSYLCLEWGNNSPQGLVPAMTIDISELTFLYGNGSLDTPYSEKAISGKTLQIPYESYADKLHHLGLFSGTDKGYELDREPTRLEALVMLIRLLGKENEAQAMASQPCKFNDVPSWGIGYVNYGYLNGLTNGISDTHFGSSQLISAKSYTTFLLRALGYDDNAGDFTWDQAIYTAYEKKMLGVFEYRSYLESQQMHRGDMAYLSYKCLELPCKGENYRLVDALLSENSIDEVKVMELGFYESPRSNHISFCFANGEDKERVSIGFVLDEIRVYSEFSDDKGDNLRIRIYGNGYDWKQDNSNSGSAYGYIYPKMELGNTYTMDISYFKRDGNATSERFLTKDKLKLIVTNEGPRFILSDVYTLNKVMNEANTEVKDYYLEPSLLIQSDDPEIIALAEEITAGAENQREVAVRIHDWVTENIYYDMSGGTYDEQDALSVLNNRYAVCEGYSNLTAALYRATGIPVRIVKGYAIQPNIEEWDQEKLYEGYMNHAWVEAYVKYYKDNAIWMMIDPTWDSANTYENDRFISGGIIYRFYYGSSLEWYSYSRRITYIE